MDVPGVPTEVMRSWVGQDVTVLAYAAGTMAAAATGTPGGVPGRSGAASPGDIAPGYYPVPRDFHGRMDDISNSGSPSPPKKAPSPSSPGIPS